ncbi:MAG: hypothetical protein WC606_01720 [Candidatus Absconditabacterales bacterium]
MDTTYFGRKYGIMVFRSNELKKNILRKEVNRETIQGYKDGIKTLQDQGWIIKAIVCDGKRGLLGGLNLPVQMCLFHQKQIMRRYITMTPKLEANIELQVISGFIGDLKKSTIQERLNDRYSRHKEFLLEKNDNGNYVHTRTRKAYRSLKNNLQYLYTFSDYKGIIDIPRTTNSIESVFSHMKQKVGLHRGLRKDRKLRLIDEFLGK